MASTPRITCLTNHSIDVDEVDCRKRGDNLREDIVKAAATPPGVSIQEAFFEGDDIEEYRQKILAAKRGDY